MPTAFPLQSPAGASRQPNPSEHQSYRSACGTKGGVENVETGSEDASGSHRRTGSRHSACLTKDEYRRPAPSEVRLPFSGTEFS